jgi:hypothetical protein
VVGSQAQPQQGAAVPGAGPLVEAAADGAVRAARGGDAFVAAAVYQGGDHVIEHDAVADASAVAAPRVARGELGPRVDPDQGSELDPQRLDDR